MLKTLALILVLMTMITTTAAMSAAPIKCAGCKTEYYLINHLKGPFAEATGINLLPGQLGNKKAVNIMLSGKIDFAFTCKSHQKLAKKFNLPADKISDWVSTSVARDPIVVVVNQLNDIDNLTIEELKKVFSGEIKSWADLGGRDHPVQVTYLAETVESGVVTVFKETTVGKNSSLQPSAKKMDSPNQLGNYTKSHPGAITFMGLNSYKKVYGKVLAVNSVLPEKDMIIQGAYPLAVTYYLVTREGDNPGSKFLEYLGTPEGQELIDQVMVAIPQKKVMVP